MWGRACCFDNTLLDLPILSLSLELINPDISICTDRTCFLLRLNTDNIRTHLCGHSSTKKWYYSSLSIWGRSKTKCQCRNKKRYRFLRCVSLESLWDFFVNSSLYVFRGGHLRDMGIWVVSQTPFFCKPCPPAQAHITSHARSCTRRHECVFAAVAGIYRDKVYALLEWINNYQLLVTTP